MKIKYFILLFSVLTIHTVSNATPLPSLSKINYSDAPKTKQWQQFMAAPFEQIQKLPILYKGGNALMGGKNLSWEWRMALVKRCQSRNEPICLKILSKSLEDTALVVRSAAARAFSERYRGTKDAKALKILEHVFQNPANYRNGRSMFVQESILSAIHSIGGLSARSIGHRLSKNDKSLRKYWKDLNNATNQ